MKRLTIGFFINTLQKDLPLFRGVAAAAQKYGVNLFCFVGRLYKSVPGYYDQGNVLYDLLDVERFDGLITWAGAGAGLGEDATPDEMREFFDRYTSIPLINYEKAVAGLHSLRADTAEGMRAVLRHLIGFHKRRRVVLLRGPLGHFETEERVRAYRETLAEFDIPHDPRLVLPPFAWGDNKDVTTARYLDASGLRPGLDFDGVAGTEPYLANAAIRVLQARGVQVPQSVGVVGFNESPENVAIQPSLTTVDKAFFNSGYRALELLLDLIAGRDVPEETLVPCRLLVRGSCGCVSQTVWEAGQGIDAVRDASPASSSLPDEIPEAVRLDLSRAAALALEPLPPLWMAGLWKAFSWEVQGKADMSFLNAITALVAGSNNQTNGVDWNRLLNHFRAGVYPWLAQEQRARAETILHQARIFIDEYAVQQMSRASVATDRRLEILNHISSSLAAALDFTRLQDAIDNELPWLDIPSCYINIYDDPAQPTGMARLAMAYVDGQHIDLTDRDVHFPARQLVPPDLLPQGRRYTFVIEPLCLGRRQMGFALFEWEQFDETIYEYLQGQISAALDRLLTASEVYESENRYHILVDNLREMILVHRDGSLLFTNRAAQQCMEQMAAGESLLGDVLSAIHLKNQGRRSRLRGLDYEINITDNTGQERCMIVRRQEIIYNRAPAELIILVDITERKRLEDHLLYLSSRDTLTGVYNRTYFEEQMGRLRDERGVPVSILVMDIDGLKAVNDSLGHQAGDQLLRMAASALSASFRGEDIIARIGGDEFSVILPDMDETGMHRSIERVMRHLDEINQGLEDFTVRLSVGGATALPLDDIDEVFKRADQMMYHRKAASRLRKL